MQLNERLSDAIKRAGYDNYNMSQIPHNPAFVTLDGEYEIFSCEVRFNRSQETSAIHSFRVHEPFTGKKIAAVALKEIALHALSESVTEIKVLLVRGDGLSFWPRFGAHPPEPLYQKFFTPPHEDENFLSSERGIFEEAFKLAATDPMDAWHYVTAPETKASNDCIKYVNRASLNKIMLLPLRCPVAQRRLGINV
jgi:hypothetical protein